MNPQMLGEKEKFELCQRYDWVEAGQQDDPGRLQGSYEHGQQHTQGAVVAEVLSSVLIKLNLNTRYKICGSKMCRF